VLERSGWSIAMDSLGGDFAVRPGPAAAGRSKARHGSATPKAQGIPFAAAIENSWFSVVPSASTAASVARLWREIWRFNAVNALSAAEEGLATRLPRLMAAVRGIDLDQRLEPRVCARSAALMEAMGKGDGAAVYDILQAWCVDPPESWATQQILTESIAHHGWEQELLAEVRGTRVKNVKPLSLFPLLETDLTPLHDAAIEALALIGAVDPEMHAEITAHVSLIKLFSGAGVEGFSSPKAFGAIWLRLPEPGQEIAWFLEHLVHECSHLHLNALLALDPLLVNPQEIHQAPIRPDPRPLFQVLHGTFVLWRNCRVHRRLVEQFPELGLQDGLAEFEEQLARGTEVIATRMRPTDRGRLLLQSF
jgi:HEXXH motif-containing protein